MTLLAHKDADGGVQTLRDHLHNAGDLAESYESEFSQIPRMAALLHDVGKVAQQFQTYLISGKGRRGEIPHARQGAFVVNDLPISNSAAEIVKEILELVIAKHHGELPDCINEIGDEAFLTGFTEADKQNPKYAYGEIKQGLHDLDLDLQDTFQQAEKDVFDFAGRTKLLKLSKDSRYFYSGLLVKYVYSRLIDADRTDTAYFETKEQYHPIKADWSELIRRLDESMKSFDSTSEINKIRQQITEQCRQAGSRETGIYRLSVPTGGGKTLASLNFALHHALETGKRRIIYVIPYLSITSQTVATFRNMLGLDADSNIVLEHYSTAGLQNSGNTGSIGTSEEEDAKERQRKLASERWDNPIIVTTMVEFLETVMSARGTKLRKFHNMANSVIIFDEIQSLPLNIINPFNEVVSFLSTILDSTILLCSATQPLLERTARKNLRLSDEPDLIDNTDGYEEKLKRTRIIASQESKSCEELANIIYEQALRNGNCLSIVNTKSEARKMYQCLQELNADGQFELIHANPNGDPLNGNRPRTTSEGLGEVSDVALKRKIRNRLQDAGETIFVQSDDRSDDGAKSLSDRFNTYLKTLPKEEQKQKNLVFQKVCEQWLDVRAFGQVFAFKKAKDVDEVSLGVRGPVSIQAAFSVEPIAIDDVQITKSVNSETTDTGKKSSDTMGMKYRVSGRAVYATYGSISPQLAEKTGFTAEDAEKIKEALVTLFENDESSARPAGSMEVLDVVWFTHNSKSGQYSSAKVHRSVSVNVDGTVAVNGSSIPDLRYEVIEGR